MESQQNSTTTSAIDSEKDLNHLKAACKIGISISEMATLFPDKFNKEEFDKMMAGLTNPPSLRNISADCLKKMLVDDYIKQASVTMANNFKDRKCSFFVKEQDEDIISMLEDVWKTQSIKFERAPGKFLRSDTNQNVIKIDLTW